MDSLPGPEHDKAGNADTSRTNIKVIATALMASPLQILYHPEPKSFHGFDWRNLSMLVYNKLKPNFDRRVVLIIITALVV